MKGKTRLVCCLGLTVALAGCGIPASMHVREGGEPRYQDEDVLFRTTYYFRVFDFCEDAKTVPDKRRIQSDSLYRFRMTGKGISTYNKVRFESGTLQAWQIDPLGASVEFDRDTLKPYFVSQQKREESLRQDKLYAEVSRLRGLFVSVGCKEKNLDKNVDAQCQIVQDKISDNLRLIGPAGMANLGYWRDIAAAAEQMVLSLAKFSRAEDGQDPQVAKDLLASLSQGTEAMRTAQNSLTLAVVLGHTAEVLNGLKNEAAKFKAVTFSPSPVPKDNVADKKLIEDVVATLNGLRDQLRTADAGQGVTRTATQGELQCGDGTPARRGFQILGPEGWRTFDQDERLVLAMSSSGKPLLDTLRDLSSRVMTQKSTGLSRESLLAEMLAVSRAKADLPDVGAAANANDLSKALDAVVAAFNRREGGK